ncbi:uncharacterized protein [Aristolochia californica]|uniref:uncharacterized protein n=1 Tax=Aristolochia californica TaxID=171875 RepID=UPI0035DA2266
MEGLIPFVYKAIVQYRTGSQASLMGSWINDSQSASYIRLPGDSGRFQTSEIQLFRPEYIYNSASSASGSNGPQSSPLSRSTSRRLS